MFKPSTNQFIEPLLGSASSLDRTIACPASRVLPREGSVPGPSAERGARIHKFLELAQTDLPAAMDAAGENRRTCDMIDIAKSAGHYARPEHLEVAFVYDPAARTCRNYQGVGREYGLKHVKEVPGTADVVIPGFRTAEVWDYKTGKTDYGPPEDSAQLKFAALCTSLTLAPQATKVLVGFQYLRAKGQLENNYAELRANHLDEFEAQLNKTLDKVRRLKQSHSRGSDIKVNPGEKQCMWCPAKAACPVWSR